MCYSIYDVINAFRYEKKNPETGNGIVCERFIFVCNHVPIYFCLAVSIISLLSKQGIIMALL